jgi:hypothetical protein
MDRTPGKNPPRAAVRSVGWWIDITAAIGACVLFAWALAGEALSGTYGWVKFLPIAAIPALHVHRFTGLDMTKTQETAGLIY